MLFCKDTDYYNTNFTNLLYYISQRRQGVSQSFMYLILHEFKRITRIGDELEGHVN